jgi:hypothetical protein
MPTVPPPPPEGTVKETPPSGTLPKEVMEKLKGKAKKLNDGAPIN